MHRAIACLLACLLVAAGAAVQIPEAGLVCAEALDLDINGDPAWVPGQEWDRTPTAAFAACGWYLRDAFDAVVQYTWTPDCEEPSAPSTCPPPGCYLAVGLPLAVPRCSGRGPCVPSHTGALVECRIRGYPSASGWRPRCPVKCPIETLHMDHFFHDGFEAGDLSAWG